MDNLFTLLSLSAVMAVASFLAGILPLSLSLSPTQLRFISTVGMGVLVGTALIVIIPEGVETLYSASSISHVHTRDVLQHRSLEFPTSFIQSTAELHIWTPRGLEETVDPYNMPGPVLPSSQKDPPKTPTTPGYVGALDVDVGANPSETAPGAKEEKNDHESQHAWIGIALMAGFLLMFLIDKLPQYTIPSKPRVRTHHIALNNLGRRFNLTTSIDRDEESDNFIENSQTASARSRSFATTIGLVIHAAADGIALGASSSAANSGLSFIIFFAIMIHKAPAAFGLTSVLLKQGVSKRAARGHLFLFSLAAPAGALLTWILAHLLGSSQGGNPQTTRWWTGMLLLFSAGTFLYVAMHSMQETTASHQESHLNGNANGYADGRENSSHEQKPSIIDLAAACIGMIIPLFLQVGHAH